MENSWSYGYMFTTPAIGEGENNDSYVKPGLLVKSKITSKSKVITSN